MFSLIELLCHTNTKLVFLWKLFFRHRCICLADPRKSPGQPLRWYLKGLCLSLREVYYIHQTSRLLWTKLCSTRALDFHFFLFSSLIEFFLREDGRQHRAPSSIYRRGCMPHHHFHLQILYILRLGKLTRRGRQKVPMKIAHAHYKPYKTILFYEAPGSYELTPSKFNSGGVESDRDQNHLHFYKACVIRGQMSHESSLSRRAWKPMTILMGIRSQH